MRPGMESLSDGIDWTMVNYRDDERRGLDVSVVPVILL